MRAASGDGFQPTSRKSRIPSPRRLITKAPNDPMLKASPAIGPTTSSRSTRYAATSADAAAFKAKALRMSSLP